MVAAMDVCTDKTKAASSDPFLLATDIADYLVLKGVPFREAHEIVGRLTAHSLGQNKPYPEFSLTELQALSPAFEEDIKNVFDVDRALESRTNTGSPSPSNIAAELKRWRANLDRM